MSPRIRWRIVVPVKEARLAKTRLHTPPPLSRPELARAIALDTLEAVCRALPPADVLTVTSDEVVAATLSGWGALVIPDPGTGLNGAITAGLRAATDVVEVPSPVGLAVLLGDLPALRPQDLLEALELCAAHDRAVVPDLEGTGTVLLTGAPGIRLQPRFGVGSATQHGQGSTVLTPCLPRLRQDVDDLAALAAAEALGVGPRTAGVLGRGGSRAEADN